MRAKPIEREEARRLRAAGVPCKRIAARLQVSPASVHAWTNDIVLTPEQAERNRRAVGGPQSPEVIARRAASCRATALRRRRVYQEEGRAAARLGDPLHQRGCILYWAEGSKSKNTAIFTNSDPAMLVVYRRFLTESLGVAPEAMTLSLNVYTNNGLTIEEIETYWLDLLDLPRSCLRKHMLNHTPTSSSGKSKRRHVYGVATLSVGSTRIAQHIYGAIQEYGGFEEPKWLG